MAGKMASSAVLTAFVVVVVVAIVYRTFSTFHPKKKTFSTADFGGDLCSPSSCGDIQHISYPFRLKGDPKHCGDRRYTLSCENNHTVLYLYAGKYYVRQINYDNYTIRVVDSSIDQVLSIPHYFLNRNNFSYGDPYTTYQKKLSSSFSELSRSGVFVMCENPVNSPFYLETSTCFGNGSEYSSNSSKRYRYVKVGRTNASDVEDSCQVERMFLTSLPANIDAPNISCSDARNELVYGFELSWLNERVTSDNYCYLDNAYHIFCDPSYDNLRENCYLDEANHVRCDPLNYSVAFSWVGLIIARGTLGYMAPELFYKNIGGVSNKSDVYSFGMLLMEIASRRKNVNAFVEHSSQIYFPTWVCDQLHNGKDIKVEYATEEEKKMIMKMIIVALWCIQMKPSDRPSMNSVIKMLEEDVECLRMPPMPTLSSLERPTMNAGEYSNQSCSSIQSDESNQLAQF